VTLKIYDILGREVTELVNHSQKPGRYKVTWDGKNNQRKEVASGIYFYQLTVRPAHRPEQSRGRAGNFTETKKLVVIK
jgi:flagellar hook assembly protein FlgD